MPRFNRSRAARPDARCMTVSSDMRGAGDFAGDAPLMQDHNAVADPDQFGQFGRNGHDRDPFIGQAAQDGVDLGLGADIDAAGRLIDEQHAWA